VTKEIKIFHGIINYGTQAGLFVKELRKRGFVSFSMGIPDPFKRTIDFELLHGGNFLQKILKHLINFLLKFYCFFKYNTFHFYYGKTLFDSKIDLPFYRFLGKKVVMEYLGNDIHLHSILVDRYKLPPEHSYSLNIEEHDKQTLERFNYEKKFIDKMLVCSPCYAEFAEDAETLTLALDIDRYEFKLPIIGDKIIIMHAPTDRIFKGSTIIEECIEKLINEGYPIEYNMVQGVTHEQLMLEYQKANIFIDQISTGWYGTASIEAMAFGVPTLVFYDPLYSKYIDYYDEIAAINIDKDTIFSKLKEILDQPEQLEALSFKMRAFVEKYHSVEKITDRLVEIYQELHTQKLG
jgi:glycosyltransferase involved in cell wall biosynthesis